MDNLNTILIILLFVLIVLVIVFGVQCSSSNSNSTTEPFASIRNVIQQMYAPTDVYTDHSDELSEIKQKFQIGQPSGVLDYLPEQITCNTKQNLLVQPDVAFKPVRRSNGCTFVDIRYPG